MKQIIVLIAVLLMMVCLFSGCTNNADRFPTSEDVRAVVPQKIDSGDDILIFDAYGDDYNVRGAEDSSFRYLAYYNKEGDLTEIEFFSRSEFCCHDDDEYYAVYDENYQLKEYNYENANDPIVRLKRRFHHYF